jgi:hypothetical protein
VWFVILSPTNQMFGYNNHNNKKDRRYISRKQCPVRQPITYSAKGFNVMNDLISLLLFSLSFKEITYFRDVYYVVEYFCMYFIYYIVHNNYNNKRMTNRDATCLYGNKTTLKGSLIRVVYNKTNMDNCKNNISIGCSLLMKLNFCIHQGLKKFGEPTHRQFNSFGCNTQLYIQYYLPYWNNISIMK